jgi:hypothetical protein
MIGITKKHAFIITIIKKQYKILMKKCQLGKFIMPLKFNLNHEIKVMATPKITGLT